MYAYFYLPVNFLLPSLEDFCMPTSMRPPTSSRDSIDIFKYIPNVNKAKRAIIAAFRTIWYSHMGCLASASNASAKEFNLPPPVFLATLAKFLIATSVLRSFNTLSIFDISFDTAANNAGSSKSSSPPPPL